MESLLCYDPFRVVRGVDENLPPAVSSTNNIALHKQTRGISLDQWQRESLRVLLETPRGFNVFRLVHVNSNHSCGFYRSASVVYVEKVAVDCVDIIRLCSWKFVGNPKRINNFPSLYYLLSGKTVALCCAIVNFCSSRIRCTPLIAFPFRTFKHSFVLFWKENKPVHVTK